MPLSVKRLLPCLATKLHSFAVAPPLEKIGSGSKRTINSAPGQARRVLYLSEKVSDMIRASLSEEASTLAVMASGGVCYMGRRPCAEAARLVATAATPEEGVEALARASQRVIETVGRFVDRNISYFNCPQRRRLHHLSVFVAIVGAHVSVMHGGLTKDARDCLDLTSQRVRGNARSRAAEAKAARSAFMAAVADRLGINSTGCSRLAKEISGLDLSPP